MDRSCGRDNGDVMTPTDNVTPIRVSGPVGLLATVPSLLGFHPTNSLVMMCLSGERRRVGPVARVDLPLGHDRAMAIQLTRHALMHADEVVLVSYQDTRRRPPLLDDVLRELATAGMDVMDALVVRNGRVRPALNAALERSHPGVPVPGDDDPQVRILTAAGALAGRSVLSDREELRRSVAGPRGHRLRRAERGIDDAASGRMPLVRVRMKDGAKGGPLPDDVDALVELAMTQLEDGEGVQVEVATALAVLLTDDDVRDVVLTRAIAELDRPWLPMLISCATWTPDPLAPPLCSVLAMVAYRHGDGALAQIAVDRCLAAEPKHPLAHLMIAVMATGVRPEELERITADELTPRTPTARSGPWTAADEDLASHDDARAPQWPQQGPPSAASNTDIAGG